MTSVIIPAYNCVAYLEQSVQSALEQTTSDLEILILDDASTDHTLSLARALAKKDSRIQIVINDTNLGVAATRNRGIEAAKGEYVAFLDADDLWLPDKLERQYQAIEESGAELCYTAYSFIDSNGCPIRKLYNVPLTVDLQALLRENVIGLSSVLVKRKVLRMVRMQGDYLHEDYVFWLELLRTGVRTVGINQPLMQYRISQSNRSGNKKHAAIERWRIYRSYLGLSRIKSLQYFCSYALRGAIKHQF